MKSKWHLKQNRIINYGGTYVIEKILNVVFPWKNEISLINNKNSELEKQVESLKNRLSEINKEVENNKNKTAALFHEKHEMILEDRENIKNISEYVEIVREQIYADLAETKEWCGRLFHEKHEMIMKEHQNILDVVRVQILDYYKDQDIDSERESVLEWLRTNYIRMFPYDFFDIYMKMNICIIEDGEWKYTIHDGKKLYFPKNYSLEQAQNYYRALIAEQDRDSPHAYFDDSYSISQNSVFIDVGAAEGIIALSCIDEVEKLILIESDEMWIGALKKTFEPYNDKVEIIHKFASNKTTREEVALINIMRSEILTYR